MPALFGCYLLQALFLSFLTKGLEQALFDVLWVTTPPPRQASHTVEYLVL